MIKCTIFRTLVQKGNKWKTKKLYSNFPTNNCILQTRHYADQNFSMSKKKKRKKRKKKIRLMSFYIPIEQEFDAD